MIYSQNKKELYKHFFHYFQAVFLAIVAFAHAGIIAPVVPVAHPVVAPVAVAHPVAVSHSVVHPAPIVHHAPLIHAAPIVPVVRHAPIIAVHH